MSKIRILYGLEAAGGGALKHLVYLVTRLDRQKFEITVILSNLRDENIESEIRKMRDSGTNVLLMPIHRRINPFKDMMALYAIYRNVRKNRYDVVHAHSSKAGALFRIAAWLNHVPQVYYTPHCFYFQGKKGLAKKTFVYIEKILGRLTTKIIVSENEREAILENRVVSESKIKNINNAIDFDEYKQCQEIKETKKRFGIKDDDFVIGAIGRLVTQKDWRTYVYTAKEVLKTIPNVVFLIVGAGELYNEIKSLIRKLGLEEKVILTGHITEIYKIYGIIDVYVNTSLWEGLPYVFLEAMQYKKPIVATYTGKETPINHEETGFVGPFRDYKYIADKIVSLFIDKKLATQMGLKGNVLLTEKYSFEYFILEHEKLYGKL
jgi:glycosyltransferase involved in cell wall biosynthesis